MWRKSIQYQLQTMSSPEEMCAFVKEMKQRDRDHYDEMTQLIKTEVNSMISWCLDEHTKECRKEFRDWKILTPDQHYAREIIKTLSERGVEKNRRRDVLSCINASWLRHGCVPVKIEELESRGYAFTSIDISQDRIKHVPIHLLASCYGRGLPSNDRSYPWIVGACAWDPSLDNPLPCITQEQQDMTLASHSAPKTLIEYEALANAIVDATPAAAAAATKPRDDEGEAPTAKKKRRRGTEDSQSKV